MAEAVTSRSLIMGFQSDLGNDKNITLKNAAGNLDAETVSTNMDTIISKGVFQYADGDPLAIAVSAKVRTVTDNQLF
ncbi:MAG: DUF2922 domain-containing protein [Peptococcaceae bacterium]|nr:DUF2922 domain-containing protein [Peptococcaceae bacterium]